MLQNRGLGPLPQQERTAQTGPVSPRRNLLSNPFNCNCHLAWLGKWLRKRRVVSGNPRCQKPFFLKEIPIQDVAIQDFTCEGEVAGGGAGQPLGRQGRCQGGGAGTEAGPREPALPPGVRPELAHGLLGAS